MQRVPAVSNLRRAAVALGVTAVSVLGLSALAAAPASAGGIQAVLPTAITVTSSAAPATVGTTVTLTAKVVEGLYPVSNPVTSGYVDFTVPGTYLFSLSQNPVVPIGCSQAPLTSNGTATCVIEGGWELAGTYPVTASFAETGYQSASTTFSQVVYNTQTQFPVTSSLSSSVNPAVVGQTVNITDSIDWSVLDSTDTSVGSVDFVVSGSPVLAGVFSGNTLETFGCSAVPVSHGTATCTLFGGWPQTGTYTVTAFYSGTGSAAPSLASIAETVGRASTVVNCTYTASTETASITVGPAAPSIYDAGITGTVVTQTYVNILGNPAYNVYFTGTYSGTALSVNESDNMAPLATLLGQPVQVAVNFTSTSPNWASSTGVCTIT